jgi:hypothetical protein
MSFDKREAILERMLAILQAISATFTTDTPTVFRNRGEIPVEKLPALTLLDGSETIAISTSGKGGILAPTIFTLTPQVFVVLKPTPDASNEGIGEALSAYRMKLLKAFATDEELVGMLGANGEINYLGFESDMQTGSTMLGQMHFRFSLNYVLSPSDF